MRLLLTRDVFHPRRTGGTLWVDLDDGKGLLPFGFTCEDWDDGKDGAVYHEDDWGRLCIPADTYSIAWSWSPSHNANVPHLLHVPGRKNILIHTGNTEVDTKGCILVGLHRGVDGKIVDSKKAIEWIYSRIERACASAVGCQITIVRAPGAALVARDPGLPRQP